MSLDDFQLGDINRWTTELGECVPEHPSVNESYYNELKDRYHITMNHAKVKAKQEAKELSDLEQELLDLALVDSKTAALEPDAINTGGVSNMKGGKTIMSEPDRVDYVLETKLKQLLSQRSVSQSKSVRNHVAECRQYLLAIDSIKAPLLSLVS
jgi:hypothetical protein